MRSYRTRVTMLGLALACGLAAGCGGNAIDQGPDAAIIIDGSSTVFRISKAAQEAYIDVEPDVTVVVDNHGTGGGFARYLQGEVDIVNASREARPDETEKSQAQSIEWTRFLVGHDGITVVVNAKNTFVKALSVDQLKRLWEPGSTVQTWRDLDPSWPDRKIVLYAPDNDSGTFEFFTEAIFGSKVEQRDGVQQNSDDNILINGVANDPDGLGYFGYAYYLANADRLSAVAIQPGPDADAVAPSPETIAAKTYVPLSRPLYLFVKNASIRGRLEFRRFLTYYLENVSTLAKRGGYDPPTVEEIEANLADLEKLSPPPIASEP